MQASARRGYAHEHARLISAPMSRASNYVKSLVSSSVVTLASVVVGLLLVPYSLRFLDREQYAVFTLAGEVLLWLGLLDIGITSVLNVKVAQMAGRSDASSMNTLVSTTFFAQLAIAALVATIGTALAIVFPNLFALRSNLHDDATDLVLLMVGAAALQVATQTFSALLIGHQQMHVDNCIKLGLLVVRTVLTIWLLQSGYGLLALGYAHFAAVVLACAVSAVRVVGLPGAIEIRPRHFSLVVLRETGGTGLWFSLGGFAGILIMSVDKVVAAKVVSVEMVTTLALTGRLYLLAWTLIQQITNAARPALAQIIGEGQMEHALKKYQQLAYLTTSLAIVAAFSVWAANASFVQWWVGSQNYGGAPLDVMLAMSLVLHCWVLPNRAVLTSGLTSVPQSSLCRVAEGCLNLALSVALGIAFGLVGIAAATVIAGVLSSGWFLPRLTGQLFHLPTAQILRALAGPLLGVASLCLVLAVTMRQLSLYVDGLPGAVLAATLTAVGGVVVSWFVMPVQEREMYLAALRKPRGGP
jgi:O-antigen/teichoic acid export membrane protein